MKQTDLFRFFLLFFFCIVFAACSDNDEQHEPVPLHLDSSSCEVMLDRSISIGLTASEDVTLTVQNPAVVSASYQSGNLKEKVSSITIYGKQKGRTTISITDNKTQETAQLTVEVVDKYLAYSIKTSNHPELKAGITLFLINNENRDCYFSRLDKRMNKQTVFAQGTYDFLVEKNDGKSVPYLTLTYGFKEEGDLTNALPQPALHKFDISDSNSNIFGLIQRDLGVDWKNENEKTMSRDYIVVLDMNMKESETDYVVKGVIDLSAKIPEGVMPRTLFTTEVTSSRCDIHGDQMTPEDKAKLESEMLSSVKGYRFTYINDDVSKGKAYIYTKGFNEAEYKVYDFISGGKMPVELGPCLVPTQILTWYILTSQDEKLALIMAETDHSKANGNDTRMAPPMDFSYYLDVTARYKTKYPSLEKAYIIQKYSRW